MSAGAPPYPTGDLYDLKYATYAPDVDFYVAAAKEARGPVLEVGCGTGRILFPTMDAGVDIEGFDLRREMLDALERKARARGLTPRVFQADMREFTAPRRYALITTPFRAFQHNLTTGDQLATLGRIREHLLPGGALVFNIFHVSFDLMVIPDGVSRLEQEFTHPETGHVVRVYFTPFRDRVNQIVSGEGEVQEIDESGAIVRTEPYAFRLRWTYKAEMELLLTAAGFARCQVWGGFDRRPLERDTDEMVWTAWVA